MHHTFPSIRSRYFDPLCKDLGLDSVFERSEENFDVVSAAQGQCSVFLECERGLCIFAVGENGADRPLCDIETFAQRFPSVRIMSRGTQRLSLREQADLIRNNWSSLQNDFSAEGLPQLKKWFAQVQRQLTEHYAGGS